MTCSGCGSWCALSDNYCRRCGARLQVVLPAVAPERSLAGLLPPVQASLVVKGVAAIVAAKAVDWAIRRVARSLAAGAGEATRTLVSPPRTPSTASLSRDFVAAGAVATDVVVIVQRIRRFRGGGGPQTEHS